MSTYSFPQSSLTILPPLVKKWVFDPSYFSEWDIPLSLEDCGTLIQKKQDSFDADKRAVLVDTLLASYSFLDSKNTTDAKVLAAIQSLALPTTFTVTTGQQLHVFLGPMYVPHKILSALAYTRKLQALYPHYNFVPIFWLASEDHDFEEIASIQLFGKTFTWDCDTQGGATGLLPTAGIVEMCNLIKETVRFSEEELSIFNVFETAYQNAKTLSEATIKIVHAFFGDLGVVCLDANTPALKSYFSDIFTRELQASQGFTAIQQQSEKLVSKGFSTRINPRDTPFFMMEGNNRERIDRIKPNTFIMASSQKEFSLETLLTLLQENPEKISPNVSFRPLYQETILPNLVYVGGAAEVEYWLQLTLLFKAYEISYPLVIMRKTSVYLGEKWLKSWEQLGMEPTDLFLARDAFNHKIETRFLAADKEKQIMNQFDSLIQSVADWTYELSPQEVKGLKSKAKTWKKELQEHFNNLELQLKQSNEQKIKKINKIYDMMYPGGVFQERTMSFLEYALKGGEFVDNYVSKFADSYTLDLKV
jgi:bacillithiol biosynthesis cysteine-adding enzyme BshC